MADAKSPKVVLIPWDYESEEHAERMCAQRTACGWRYDEIELWRDLGRKGTKTLYWIVLGDGLANMEVLLAQHTSKYPQEASPIRDTASVEWLKPRVPSNAEFTPVGHIALDTREEENAHIGITDDAVAWVAGLYISWVLQKAGLGRAVMRAAESRAASDVLGAKTMVLDTMPTEQQLRPVFVKKVYTSRGIPPPVVSNQTWYERQGYVIFHRQKDGYMWPNPETGGKDPTELIFLKKALV